MLGVFVGRLAGVAVALSAVPTGMGAWLLKVTGPRLERASLSGKFIIVVSKFCSWPLTVPRPDMDAACVRDASSPVVHGGTVPCIHLFCLCPAKTCRVEFACAIDSAETGPLSVLRLFGDGGLRDIVM